MNSLPIYGNIICQNGMPDLLRTLDSMSKLTDKIFIVDGGSTDGTLEWLESVKDVYNLEIYSNPFQSMLQQRNWLLAKTPKPSWVLSLDQDEELNAVTCANLADWLHGVPQQQIDENRGKVLIHAFLWFYNMIQDTKHYASNFSCHLGTKCFLYDENVTWETEYHCQPHIKGSEVSLKLIGEHGCGIKHYALLNPARHAKRCVRLKDNKDAGYEEYYRWCEAEHTVTELPEAWW